VYVLASRAKICIHQVMLVSLFEAATDNPMEGKFNLAPPHVNLDSGEEWYVLNIEVLWKYWNLLQDLIRWIGYNS
jgi:hypothetical protein